MEIGDRMKRYEAATRAVLPPRSTAVIRVDGKSFSKLTSGMDKPFDLSFIKGMDAVAAALIEHIPGARMAYVQSDEVSVVVDDLASHDAQMWMGGVVQKMASVAASIATAAFNEAMDDLPSLAFFDGRVFSVSDQSEVGNYLLWRVMDASRNSVSMAAASVMPHPERQGMSTAALQEELWQRGINWNDYSVRIKRGALLLPVKVAQARVSSKEAVVYRTRWTFFDPQMRPNAALVGAYLREREIDFEPPPIVEIPEPGWLAGHWQEPAKRYTGLVGLIMRDESLHLHSFRSESDQSSATEDLDFDDALRDGVQAAFADVSPTAEVPDEER